MLKRGRGGERNASYEQQAAVKNKNFRFKLLLSGLSSSVRYC